MRHHSISALVLFGLSLTACTTASTMEAEKEGPKNEEARLIKLAQDIERRGDSSTAASLYERAAASSSDKVGAYSRLGNAQLAVYAILLCFESYVLIRAPQSNANYIKMTV